MNLKEYSKILNDTLEKIEKETGEKFNKDVEMLAINKYLNTPVMKAAYPEISLLHDAANDSYLLEYKSEGFYKFYGAMTEDGFEFRQRFGSGTHLLNNFKYLINNSAQLVAQKIKELLKPETTFEQFLDKITVQDLNVIMPVADKSHLEFLKVLKLMKEDAPFDRNFLKSVLKNINQSSQNNKIVDNHTEDRIYEIIKEGLPEGGDALNQLKRLLHVEGLEISNYDFDDIDEDRQVEFYYKIIKENLPKNSVSYLLVNDPKNFAYNIFDQFLFDHVKSSLSFTMKLISNDVTVEQIYKDYPVIDEIFNEALKQDPLLNELPENLFKHTVIRDKDIYNEENGVDYFAYVEHIVDKFERANVMQEYFKTTPFRRSYTVIDPELDVDVVRFIGTTGHDMSYLLCASVDDKSENKYKILQLDTYLLTKNVTPEQLEGAIKIVINYCKQNEYILSLGYNSMKHGLNYDEADIFCNTVEKYRNEICAILLPSSSEDRRLSLIKKLDIPYTEIVANDKKIGEMLDANMPEDDMIKALKTTAKPLKLKM